ncbi:MAG: radical SAM protein [Dethiobacter sp.]|jgi:radical SAM superfamily enzyme YgiQ (UPF0313 family)|nr:radical SAM protein [Dethiobacter sp.]MBS3989854.1 radical SAM protein [Dethiobacter sp.]
MPNGKVQYIRNTGFVPQPEKVLVTTAPRDVYEHDGSGLYKRLPVLTADGFEDGFAEYTTNIPDGWKFSTRQKDYGYAFLESNIIGPTYLHYPLSETIAKHLENCRYDVLCISAFTWTLPWALELARKAKSEYKIKEVWLGGYAVMTDEPQIYEVFDRLFWGYCESIFNESIGLGQISASGIKHPDLTTRASWLGRDTTVGHLLFRRGCPNRCTYCADPAFAPGGDESLSLAAVEEILDYYKSNAIKTVYISNQDTNLLSGFGREVLEAIKKRKMNFGMLTSFQALSLSGENGIRELRDNGLTFLLVGLESLNDINLEKTKRRSRQIIMEKTLGLLRQLDIIATSTYMICFEDDSEASIREAKRRIIDLGLAVCLFNITVPLPGTPMYYEYKEKGLISDWNWSRWTGNYLVWKHPVISTEKAQELLAEIRSEVNHPAYNGRAIA